MMGKQLMRSDNEAKCYETLLNEVDVEVFHCLGVDLPAAIKHILILSA